MPAKNLRRIDRERAYIHVFNKGLDNKVIFNDEADYQTFIGFINEYLSEPVNPKANQKSFTIKGKAYKGVPHQPKNYFNELEVISYCIKPTYFSIIVHQVKVGSLEKFIRSLCTRYSIYFNKKYNRSGSLFQGPYKSLQVDDISSLILLSYYLHRSSDHSSYPEYTGKRTTPWVNTKVVLYPLGNKNYEEFVEKKQLSENEKNQISNLLFGKIESQLERRDLAKYNPVEGKVLASIEPLIEEEKKVYRIPEYALATFIFIFLLGVGLFNISSTAQAQKNLTLSEVLETPLPELITEVLSEQTESTPDPISLPNLFTPEPSPSVTPEPAGGTESEVVEVANVAELSSSLPQIGLLVTIGNTGGDAINIRNNPSETAEIIGAALAGEMYEVIEFKSGWAEIKLLDGRGFIPQRYLKVE